MISRNISLDGLRGISILLVVLSHFCTLDFYTGQFINGAVGVAVFFVLSGYFIGLQLQKIKSDSLPETVNPVSGVINFYIRRFLRIIPLYIIVILILNLLPFYVPASIKENFRTYLLMNQNWMMFTNREYDGILGPLWSLSLEVKFYLIWPLFYVLMNQRNYQRFTILMLFVGILGRLVTGILTGKDGYANLLLISTIDCFAAGLLMSRTDLLPPRWRNPYSLNWKVLLSVAAVIYLLILFASSFYTVTVFRRTAVTILSAWIILLCTEEKGRIPVILSNKILVYLGTRSYSIYVLHGMTWWFVTWMIFLLNRFGGTSIALSEYGWEYFTMKILLTLLISEISYRFIEIPFNRLRHRLP